MSPGGSLVALPLQPPGVPWPDAGGDGWPTGPAPAATIRLVDDLVGDTGRYGDTYAVLVVQGGRLLVERYGGALPHFDRPAEPVVATTRLLSWSMAKSVLHATVGLLVADGRLRVDEPPPVPAWHADPGDPRARITLEHLLTMRDGLDFVEDYVDAGRSDVIEMLFGAGQDDVAGYAEARSLAHEPGSRFNYSSGTSNIVAAAAGRAVGGGSELVAFMTERLFAPIGVRSAEPRLDAAGTFVGSSYVYATARDWARFGLLYLRDGRWQQDRVLPEGWVDHGRRQRSVDEEGNGYGAHWWVVDDGAGTFRASGYEGQMIVVCPTRDLLVVRLGRTPEEQHPALVEWRGAVVTSIA